MEEFWNRIIIEHNRLKSKYDHNGEALISKAMAEARRQASTVYCNW